MPVTIALLGLNRVSASLGLALAKDDNIVLVGYDNDPELARRAQQRGMLKRAEINVFNAIANADLVLLCRPLSEQRELLKLIANDVRAGGVVASVSGLLNPPVQWGAELLDAQAERYFVAAHPILNPAYLHSGEIGLNAAQADLFKEGLWALAPAKGCASEALKLLSDLAHLVKAKPYYIDPLEHDGLMGVTDGLPTLFAALLFRAARASPGWPDARKVADRTFATATAALVDADFAALSHNRAALLHYVEAALRELGEWRAALQNDHLAPWQTAFNDAFDQREEWLAQRGRGDWEAVAQDQKTTMPSVSEILGRALIGNFFKRDKDKGER
jgi:prephenate dehydrogenase